MAEDDNELEGVPKPGDVIVDKYRVERVLGIGGMGCVVAATHLTLDQTVAIKFLLAKPARNPKNITRFQREAQAAAKIRSDHVAKVSDIGTLPSGTPYMVMEFLDGEDLADRLERGSVQLHECAEWVLQACEALAEAHQAGIVHRDLKPANLFLAKLPTGAARVKVLDFGISKIVQAPGAGGDLTKTSALMGSPLYMSPEQMMSAKAADARADIWALGCILFEALTGQPPFIGDTLPEICSKILTSPPTPLMNLAPNTPPEFEAVVMCCLEKKPENRYANLGELATALAHFAGSKGISSAKTTRRVLDLPELDDSAFLGGAAVPGYAPPLQAAPPAPYGAVPAAGDATASGAYGAAPPVAPPGAGFTAPQGGPPHMTAPGAVAQGATFPGGGAQAGVSQSGVQPAPVAPAVATHGAISQGAVSQGAVSQGAISQGAVSQGAISQGAVSQSGVQAAPIGQGATVVAPDGVAPGGMVAPQVGGLPPPTVAAPPAAYASSSDGQAAALALGAATGAPVAQTMADGSLPPSSKLPLVLSIMGVAAVLIVVAVVFATDGSETETDEAAAAVTATAANPRTAAPLPTDSASELADSTEPAADGSAAPSASPVASASAAPAKTAKGTLTVPTKPKPTQPGYKVKQGDDGFNQR
ncbi:MAG: serine/threonine protein kinase [Deltaproteobacteria bacterium]|nr:MAG: serine/threonine protein kinase [Deltaproteobacteria bacterium]